VKLPESIGPYQPLSKLVDDGVTRSYRVAGGDGARPRILKTFPLQPYADPESRERFQREVTVHMGIRHPNVWEVVDFGFYHETIPYLVMEDFGGQTLVDELKQGPLDLPRWHMVMADVLLGVDAMHRGGVVHRFLAPDKIWVTSDGQCKIFDFGLSARLGLARLTPSGVSMGTPLYAAPEQLFNAHHVDHRADLFSVGVMGFELLTGHLPIETKDMAERMTRGASGDLDPLSKWRRDLPVGYGTWLAHMTAMPRERRFEHAIQAYGALLELNG
jgi:serine/threonine-protein kinase